MEQGAGKGAVGLNLGKSGKALNSIPRRSLSSIMIVIGAALLLTCLLQARPLYTFAGEPGEKEDHHCRITVDPDALFNLGNLNPGDSYSRTLTVTNTGDLLAYLWLLHEWVDGDPPPGEWGDLFAQLEMVISWRSLILYQGPADGLKEPLNISAKIPPLGPGQSLDLDFGIFLPGPETGNEFQGSTVITRVIIITACGTEDDVPPEPPGTDPPGTDPPDLPRTDGLALTLISLLGFALILLGLILRKPSAGPGRA